MSVSELKYLLTIKELSKTGSVRSKDVADKMHLSRASVCRAMDRLNENRLALRDDKNNLLLTEKGKSFAEKYGICVRRLEELLIKRFQCAKILAYRDAVKLACAFSEENFEKLLGFFGEESRDSAADGAV